MYGLTKPLILAFLAFGLLFGSSFSASSEDADIYLKVKDHTLSANIKEIPLKTVLEKLRKETGIWIKGSESLLQDNISAQFDNLSLHDGLNRILSSMNYSLVFGPNDKLEGVVIIGKGKSPPATAKRTAVSRQRSLSSSPKPAGSSKAASRVYKKSGLTESSSTSRGPLKMTAQEKEMFQVRKSSTAPGGHVKATPEELEKFKVEKNVAPPGGPVNSNQEEVKRFKVIKNSPPPENPNAPSIDTTVIKNCPPPGS